MKKVAIITARGGSKGLVDKNMLMVYGKPLIAYTIENALDSGVFDEVILTTDSLEYIEALSHYPITMHERPEHLASDTATSYQAIEEVIVARDLAEKYDYFVQFQPTTPYRLTEHTVDLCRRFEQSFADFDFAASVTVGHKPSVLTRAIDEQGGMSHWDIDYSTYRRQNFPVEYTSTGVYFVAKINAYLVQKHFYGPRSMAYVMDRKYSLDIDDREDFEYFYFLMSQDKREELLRNQVIASIHHLAPALSQSAELTLLGDSYLSHWDTASLGIGSVQNLSVDAISTRDYIDSILSKCTTLADRVIVGIGRDDLRKKRCSPRELVDLTLELIRAIKRINPNAEVTLLELAKTHFRVDCDNKLWDEFNPQMREAVAVLSGVRYVEVNHLLCNSYGKLSPAYTADGYNLNVLAYQDLEKLLNL